MKPIKYLLILSLLFISSCSDDNDDLHDNATQSNLIIKLKFDPNQERLNNLGQPAAIPAGNAAQSPNVNRMSANYIEFAPSALTLLGEGEIIFEGTETNVGGEAAIDFQQSVFAGDNETFLTVPLSDVTAGSYEWVRVSLAYQEGNIDLLVNGTDISGTLASFVGYNSYITSFDLNR